MVGGIIIFRNASFVLCLLTWIHIYIYIYISLVLFTNHIPTHHPRPLHLGHNSGHVSLQPPQRLHRLGVRPLDNLLSIQLAHSLECLFPAFQPFLPRPLQHCRKHLLVCGYLGVCGGHVGGCGRGGDAPLELGDGTEEVFLLGDEGLDPVALAGVEGFVVVGLGVVVVLRVGGEEGFGGGGGREGAVY